MMLRSQDSVALILALILARMAWNDSTELLSASAHLTFYLPREKASVMSPMDVDGDGTNKALAVIKAGSSTPASWELQILDLKPLYQFSKTDLAPFRPSVLFASSETNEDHPAIPIKLVAGQVLVKRMNQHQSKEKPKPVISGEHEIDDRNCHYFCGTDWHDASSKCATPCPAGQASKCSGDDRCFADTPCDMGGGCA
jgi:hypothetical protein